MVACGSVISGAPLLDDVAKTDDIFCKSRE